MGARRVMGNAATGTPAALLYRRVSSNEQAREGLSLGAQAASTRGYAARLGMTVAGEFEDVLSGTRDDRPGYALLLDETRRLHRARRPVVVVVARLDRFGRSVLERARSAEEFRALGVQLHSADEGGAIPELVANILAAVAEEEVRRTGSRIASLRRYVVESGWSYPGRPAWGYTRKRASAAQRAKGAPHSVLVIDPLCAPHVQEVWRRVAGGEAIHAVAQWVASLPAQARGGRYLGYGTLRKMLSAPVYVGRAAVGGPSVLSRPRCRWTPLIEDETWQRAQRRLAEIRRRKRTPLKRSFLAGLVRCRACGGLMGFQHRTRQRDVYSCVEYLRGAAARGTRCGTTVQADTVVRLVTADIRGLCGAILADPRPPTPAAEACWESLARTGDPGDRPKPAALEEPYRREWLAAALRYVDGKISHRQYERARANAQAALAMREQQPPESENLRGPVPTLGDLRRLAQRWLSVSAGVPPDSAESREDVRLLVRDIVPVRQGRAQYRTDVRWSTLGNRLCIWLAHDTGHRPQPPSSAHPSN
jgi:DNA invertase Pin-like site-specific DNA recombinase